MRRRDVLAAAGALPALAWAKPGRAASAVNYLLPAPAILSAFAPHQLAKARGYFSQNGVEVTFVSGRGGADVAKQVALGNGDVGTCLGEVVVVVRANDLPVRNVALLGGHPLYQIAFRRALGAKSVEELRGRRVGVVNFEDSGYYALLGVLAAIKLPKTDLNIKSVTLAGIRQLMINGDLDAAMANPDDMIAFEDAGLAVDAFPIETLFPGMAQVLVASDETIKRRPEMVQGVARGLVQAVQSIVDDPVAAARDYIAAVPQHSGEQAAIERSMRLYATLVYKPGKQKLGAFDPQQIATVQRILLENGLIRKSSPVDDLYTNEFVS